MLQIFISTILIYIQIIANLFKLFKSLFRNAKIDKFFKVGDF